MLKLRLSIIHKGGFQIMKKQTILLAIFVLGLTLLAQDIQQEAISINVEVPVRVYKGNNFVADLTINDFEVYEDGILQDVEAVYLINKMNIQSKEEKQTSTPETSKTFKPQTSRSFYLFFEVVEYSPNLDNAINYFFKNVLAPSDNLTIVTPMSMYRLKSEFLSKVPREEAINQVRKILRKDAWNGNSEYNYLIRDLEEIIRSMSSIGSKSRSNTPASRRTAGGGTVTVSAGGTESDPLVQLGRYEEILNNLERIRNIDQQKILDFANILKDKQGQKHVFMFYQREFIPQLTNTDYVKRLGSSGIVTKMKLIALMGYFFRDANIDIDRIKQAYADSSVSINFLFFTKPAKYIPGVQMAEHSEDVFSVFREMAQATGGIMSSSSNPEYLFKQASNAVESYYLLYYAPKNYIADGKFKTIKINVKGQSYRITHRAGYIAD